MKRHLLIGITIALFAFLIRGTYVALATGTAGPLNEDEIQYDEIARNIVETGSFYQDFGDKRFYSFRAPLYPYFLAGVYAITGGSQAAVIFLQCFLDAIVAVLVYVICRMVFSGGRVSIVAAVLYCVYPFAIYRCAFLMTEVLFALVLAVGVVAFVFVERRAKRGECPGKVLMAGGFLLGLAALTKAGMVVMIPLVGVWAFWVFGRSRAAWKAIALVGGSMVLTLMPWTVRNYAIHGKVVLVATEGGTTLLGGNNRVSATSDEFLGFWYNPSRLHLIPAGLSEVEESAAQTRSAMAFIGTHMDWMPRLLLYKFLNTWVVHPYGVTHGPLLARWARATYTLLVPFFVAGLVLVGTRARLNPAILWLLLLNVLILGLIFYGSSRFRAPVEPYIIIFSAVPLSWILDKVLHRPVRVLADDE